MLNAVTLQCRLTKDPELKTTQSGIPVALFSVACSRDYKSKETGEAETDFFDVVAWRHTAEFLKKYFAKGSMAVVQGRMEQQKWVDKEGHNRSTVRLVAENIYFGDTKKKEESNQSGYGQTGNYGQTGGYNQSSYSQNNSVQQGNNLPLQGVNGQGTNHHGNYSQGGYQQPPYGNQNQGVPYDSQNQQQGIQTPEQNPMAEDNDLNLPF